MIVDQIEYTNNAYRIVHRLGQLKRHDPRHPLDIVVLHWTVTSSLVATYNGFVRRGYSSHFIIDIDGTVYQYLDPVLDRGIHAKHYNHNSVGVDYVSPVVGDVMCPIREKVNSRYHTRPDYYRIHRREDYWPSKDMEFVNLSKAQIEVSREFLPDLCFRTEIPYKWLPVKKRNVQGSMRAGFKGVLTHMNLPRQRGKWDILGFPYSQIVGFSESHEK